MFCHAWLLVFLIGTFDNTIGDNRSQAAHCIDVSHDETECIRGCKPGYRGKLCDETCSEHCVGACSQDTGHCLTGCRPNWFSSNCSKPCTGNCRKDVCDIRSGECIHGCKDGSYGLNCNETCSGNCTEGKCDIYGGCHCEKDVLDKFCYIDCTYNCIGGKCAVDHDGQLKCLKGCKKGRMGPFCNEWCPYNCSACDDSCVSRVKRSLARDSQNNCRNNVSACQNGFLGRDCNITCPACQYDQYCNMSCAGGSWGTECHFPCPQNCSRAMLNGKSSCHHETGLCNSGCLQGYFGYKCDHTCPTTCHKNYCYMTNGSCTEACDPEYWGPYCEHRCGKCKDMICERNGSCTCIQGYYGPRCEVKCSDRCTGNCSITLNGSHICETECKIGFTGVDCQSQCPSDCRSSACSREDGTCAESSHNEPCTRDDDCAKFSDHSQNLICYHGDQNSVCLCPGGSYYNGVLPCSSSLALVPAISAYTSTYDSFAVTWTRTADPPGYTSEYTIDYTGVEIPITITRDSLSQKTQITIGLRANTQYNVVIRRKLNVRGRFESTLVSAMLQVTTRPDGWEIAAIVVPLLFTIAMFIAAIVFRTKLKKLLLRCFRNSQASPDPPASLLTPDPSASPPTPDPSASPPTPDPSASPPTTDPSASPPTPDPSASPPTPDPSASPPTPDPSASPPTPDPSASPPTPDPSASPPTTDPSASPPTTDPSASPHTTDPSASATSDRKKLSEEESGIETEDKQPRAESSGMNVEFQDQPVTAVTSASPSIALASPQSVSTAASTVLVITTVSIQETGDGTKPSDRKQMADAPEMVLSSVVQTVIPREFPSSDVMRQNEDQQQSDNASERDELLDNTEELDTPL